jgi:small-conductance mechanosensitive channel
MGNNSFFESLRELLQAKLFDIAGTQITTATLITFVLIIVATFLSSKLIRRAVVLYFHRKEVFDRGTIGVVSRLIHLLVVAVGLGLAIRTIGINIAALFAAGALFAVGIGFALQNIAQNFVSGVILMLERTIKPGDVLMIENQMVKVISMGSRAIVGRTFDDEDLIVPNSVLVQTTVKNYTLRDPFYRIRVPVGVTYSSDMHLVRTTLENCAWELPERSKEKDPIVLLTDFGNSSVNFEVSIWVDSPWITRFARSKLHEAVWWALKGAGVVIAFPQLDVHFDPPVAEGLKAFRPSWGGSKPDATGK